MGLLTLPSGQLASPLSVVYGMVGPFSPGVGGVGSVAVGFQGQSLCSGRLSSMR